MQRQGRLIPRHGYFVALATFSVLTVFLRIPVLFPPLQEESLHHDGDWIPPTFINEKVAATPVANPNETSNTGNHDDTRFVICTRLRNEAPYLREWIEYHRMIGFEYFFIFNDNSTDDTQCILDAYASKGIIVKLIPTHVDDMILDENENATAKMKSRVDRVFDNCARYLAANTDEQEKIWMLTHDVDEFVYTPLGSIHQAVDNILQAPSKQHIQSLAIPRLLFGSSGHTLYDDGLVVDRFTRRFDIDSCHKGDTTVTTQQRRQQGRRRLFNNKNPISYCKETLRHDSYDFMKSMTLVSSLAQYCYDSTTTPSNQTKVRVLCHGPHHHTLRNVTTNSTFVNMGPRHLRMMDIRKLRKEQVGDSGLVIFHYMTKSKQEFFHRTCDSAWSTKYFKCPNCTPATYFDLTEMYANNHEDTRMSKLSYKLKERLKTSDIGASCDIVPKLQSLSHYKQCFS